MSRRPQETDYTVTVEGVGSFTFGRRTMRDEFAIQVEYARIIEGVEPTVWLQTMGGWVSTLRVLTVRAPSDWDVDGMDPTEDESYAKIRLVYETLLEQERSFRRGSAVASKAGGAGPR